MICEEWGLKLIKQHPTPGFESECKKGSLIKSWISYLISVRFLGGYQNCSDFMHYSLWFSKVIFCDMKSIQSLPKNCTSGIDNSLQHINVENMLKSMHSFVIKLKFPDITYVWDIQNMECTIYVFSRSCFSKTGIVSSNAIGSIFKRLCYMSAQLHRKRAHQLNHVLSFLLF